MNKSYHHSEKGEEIDAELRDVLARDLRGLFTMPASIAPIDADVEWFRHHGRIYRNPQRLKGFVGVPQSCWSNASKALWLDPTLSPTPGARDRTGRFSS